jgi:hypothetical protein
VTAEPSRAAGPQDEPRVAEVVDHIVEYGEEGVHIEHKESVPFSSGLVSKPTLICGHLPLKFCPNNSHQAFKVILFPAAG